MRAPALALLILSVPTVALAHPGPHTATGWLHVLMEPDHLLTLAAVALLAGLGLRLWRSR